ncbi:MAG: tRNA 2-thiouridine(34) synthase MnmA [Propionibacteriaceae bacterium]|nr:tRNA 2-thiouridine(34) synthase MnmA [Propionibacteriaceae bacterium]
MSRLIVGLSGGVDSAVAAARMLEAGHEVVAVHLWLDPDNTGQDGWGSSANATDAREVAQRLGIEFEVWDFSSDFRRIVVEDFLAEYARGRTPNPCLRCNEQIKFSAVIDRALAQGFDGVVTGHYARLETNDAGHVDLHRGVDKDKDQSYVLGVLTQDRLRRCFFPLGDSTKEEVRAEAARRGITVADKPDSLDICFIRDGRTADYLHRHIEDRPGEIRSEDGQVLGSHRGIFTYTIGQRKGLRLGRPATDGQPRYVVGLDSHANTVIVGPRTSLQVTQIRGINPVWTDHLAQSEFHAAVQLRAHADEIPARISVDDAGVTINLDTATYGIAPGQTAVIYDGTRVVGSATIDSATSTEATP